VGKERLFIKVMGAVQGVGFRPFVFGLASELRLKGFVSNSSDGVTIDIEGEGAAAFLKRLRPEAPPLSSIRDVEVSPLPVKGYTEFTIMESTDGGAFTLISPDVSVCDECLRELEDAGDRRHRYPFINCTNCGPRYTITRKVPYDRPNTTMSVFPMCDECLGEYGDPASRRFHAEPNACPACGPRLALLRDGVAVDSADPLAEAVSALRQGEIVAIKGLGGFHLACDATRAPAVRLLRERKRRNRKPFALMAPDMATVKRHCLVSEYEEALLLSNKRPIVLLKKRQPGTLPGDIAPGSTRLGFMLPYTPLHHLILKDAGSPLVMTSGNLSEEPIQVDNGEAVRALGDIASVFLVHDRDIFMRVDDSVVKLSDENIPHVVRRARGYAPEPIMLHEDGPDVLAAGGDIKNAFTLLKEGYAVVSQHLGDMENYETHRFFEETYRNLAAVYRAEPVAVAYDLHPGYFSTRWARAFAKEMGLKELAVQHHHAHTASVMAGQGLRGKVIGVSLDGTGYGTDGTLWGGEFLVADATAFRRAGHFGYVGLPGGEKAVREPWRTAVSYLLSALGTEAGSSLERLGFHDRLGEGRVHEVLTIAPLREVSPLSSGAGRLFDCVSSLLGLCDVNTFEGEAAMALEAHAAADVEEDYPVDIKFKDPFEVDFSYTLICIMNDFLAGTPTEVISARFHNSVVEAVGRAVVKLSSTTGITNVVLSGGVFQNDYLMTRIRERLREAGLTAHTNRLVPVNDGGISLGQAFVLRETLRKGML
jgi:hydrogenase maturation protein HypF